MKENYLDKFLVSKTEEIKKWSYEDLLGSVDEIKAFTENYQNHKINIEVQSIKTNNGLNVMVECSIRKFFLTYVGRQKFFYKSIKGDVKDIDGDEFYKRK